MIVTTHVKRYLPGSSLESQCAGVSLGTDQEGILFPACTKTPDSQRKAGVQYKPHCLHKCFRDTNSFLSVSMVGTLPSSKFPDAS